MIVWRDRLFCRRSSLVSWHRHAYLHTPLLQHGSKIFETCWQCMNESLIVNLIQGFVELSSIDFLVSSCRLVRGKIWHILFCTCTWLNHLLVNYVTSMTAVITWHSVSMYHIAFFFFPDLFEHLSKQQISEVKLLPEGQKADAVYDGINL